MNPRPAPPGSRHVLQRLSVGAAVLACGWLLFCDPRPWAIVDTPFGLGAAAALVAYAGRRRLADALVLALPPLAGPWVDTSLGAQALFMCCVAVYLLTRRARFAAVAGGSAIALLLTAAHLKQRFAGTSLTWQDVRFFFRQFADNVGVLTTQPTLLLCAGGALGLALLACLPAWRWSPPGGRAGGPSAPAAALAALLVAHCAGLLAQGVATLSTSGAWFVAEGLVERPLLGFFATAHLAPRWVVPAVDTAAFGRDSRLLSQAGGAARPADIVVFLQESQFNPATMAGCNSPACRLDAFGAGRDTIAHGPLQVHVFGGGTWLSEFALETGVPHDKFGPAGEFASFSISPHVRRSFVRSLKAAGYHTVALYATRGGMMNGRVAYAGYGFDEFLDAAEQGLPGAWDTPDALVHQAARRILERERRQHEQPVFMFVQTIFNHAEHGVRMERVPADLLAAVSGDFAAKDEARSVADYVWRSRAFERELGLTREAVLGTPRPAVLAWFGDHQPPFANAVSLRDRMRAVPTEGGSVPAKYQTWYEVSSNRPGRVRREAPDALDLAFLPGVLAQAAGAPADDWLAANQHARAECGGLLEACRKPGVREAYLTYLWADLEEFDLP